jgi:predicted ABC-type exoprotein transport system permease subunit
MFTSGQKIFALFFIIAFAILMIWSYRKDIKHHKTHFKNTYVVIIAIIATIAIFTLITFSMH